MHQLLLSRSQRSTA